MSKIQLTLLTAALLGMFTSQSFAGNRAVTGLAIGGASGAIAGQAIGRNVESTVIGATIGGVLGTVLGSELSHHHHYAPPPPPVIHHYPSAPPPPRHHLAHKPKPRYVERCRETVRTTDGYHGSKTVISTVCWDGHRRPYRNPERHDHFRPREPWYPDHHKRF